MINPEEDKHTEKLPYNILAALSDAVIVFDVHYIILYVNHSATESIGLKQANIIGKTIREIGQPPELYNMVEKQLKRVFATRKSLNLEADTNTTYGVRYFEYIMQPLINDGGNVISVMVTARDVTDRKKAEEALRNSESRYRTLFENAPIALWEEDASRSKILLDQLKRNGVTDYAAYFTENPEALVAVLDSLKVVDVNKATLELFETDSKEELVQKLPQTFTEEAFIHTGIALATYAEGLTGFKLETTNRTLKGNIIHISLKSLVPPGHEETLSRIYFAMDDITERKRIEMELAKEKELGDALNDINASITSVLDFDEIMHRVVAGSSKAMDSETMIIFLREDNCWEGRYLFGLSQGLAGLRFTEDEAKTRARFVSSGELLVVNDAFHDERVNSESARQFNVRSFLSVPLVVRGVLVGALFFGYRSVSVSFTKGQVDFASKLATAVSVAIDNTRLFGDLKISTEKLSKRSKYLQTLNDVSLDIVSGLKVDELMPKIAKYAAELLGTDVGAVGLIREETRAIAYQFIYNLPEALIKAGVPSAEPFTKIEIPPGRGLSGKVISRKKPMVLEDYLRFQDSAPQFSEAGLRSIVMVPLFSRGVVLGTIAAAHLSPDKKFDEQDIAIMEALGRHATIAIQNAKLYEAERHIADTLQESLLVLPKQIEGIEFGYLYRSGTEAAKVGGDFYDIFEIEHGKVGIVIGDVSGKGIEAATLTSIAKNTLKAHTFEDAEPSQVLAKVNDMIVRVSSSSDFITLFFGVLDIGAGILTYCSAGHPPQLIKQSSKGVKLLDINSPIVGAFRGLNYASGTEVFKKNDRLILYTDGITEARHGDDFFGEERLVTFVQSLDLIPAKEIPLAIFSHVLSWTGGKLLDDVALFSVSIASDLE